MEAPWLSAPLINGKNPGPPYISDRQDGLFAPLSAKNIEMDKHVVENGKEFNLKPSFLLQ